MNGQGIGILILLGILTGIVLLDVVIMDIYYRRQKQLVKEMQTMGLSTVQADWTQLAIGTSGNVELEQRYLSAAQHMYETFCRKNHDYGPQNLAVGGAQGITLRLSDKVSRLWQVTGIKNVGRAMVNNESTEDTFMDSANYSIVGYLIVRGEWPKALMDDVYGPAAMAHVLLELWDNLDDVTRHDVARFIQSSTKLVVDIE
jgi:hypothetical protein